MEKEIHKKQNLAWNRAWEKRFGDGSIIEAEEVAFGHGRALAGEMLSARVSFMVIPRGIVFCGGTPTGVLAWLIKSKYAISCAAIEEENSSMLFLKDVDFIELYVASLSFTERVAELYRYSPRVYPIYHRKKELSHTNMRFEDALRFKVEDFPEYVREGDIFCRVREGKYLEDLGGSRLLNGEFSAFIFVYPDGTVHKETHSLETLYDRFLTGKLSCCLTGKSVFAFHRFEYRKFIESKEYIFASSRNRITGSDCGLKVTRKDDPYKGAVVLIDFNDRNNGVCRVLDDIDFVEISKLSNDIKVLDLSDCWHLRGVSVNLYNHYGFTLIYPDSKNYRAGKFILNKCDKVNIVGEVRVEDLIVYDSEFTDELSVKLIPKGFQNIITGTQCVFNEVTGLKRVSISSNEETAYDYSYSVTVEVAEASIEELHIEFKQDNCELELRVNKCPALRKVFLCCAGTVELMNILALLSNNKGLTLVAIRCGSLRLWKDELAKLESAKKLFSRGVSIIADRLVLRDASVTNGRYESAELGFESLPKSVRGVIVKSKGEQ